jgi:glycosyltransferase involved in cell wall biosynthesis
VESQKIITVLNSVSIEDFYPQDNIRKTYDVISVGRLVPWKRNSEILRACHELNLSLAIVGSGSDYAKLHQLANHLNARVDFLGDRSKIQLLDLYNASKFFVLNSGYEGTSHALLEARACGIFAIARENVGSNAEIISNNKDGLLFGNHELPTLLDALKYATREFKDPSVISETIRQDTELRFSQNATFPRIAELVLRTTE